MCNQLRENLINFFYFVLILLLCISRGSNYTYDDDDDEALTHGIIKKSNDYSIKFMVSIVRDGQLGCAGSIIGDKWILTVAQCVERFRPSSILIYFSDSKLTHEETMLDVESIIVHPGYERPMYGYDIALLETIDYIIFSSKINKISIGNFGMRGSNMVMVAGWGLSMLDPVAADESNYLLIRSVDNVSCRRMYDAVLQTQICTLAPFDKKTCGGEAGGPLVFEGMLHGLLSVGYSCNVGYPDVYTRVFSYWEWIESVTGITKGKSSSLPY